MSGERLARVALIAAILLGPLVLAVKYVVRPDGDAYPKVGSRVSIDYAIVQVDRLAPSALHVYNPQTPSQPAIDELARLGIVVGLAFAASDRQPASAASLLTAQLPSTHGVLDFSDRLGDKPTTLAEALHRIGYFSAAFSNLPLFSRCDLGHGFEIAADDSQWSVTDVGRRAAAWLEATDPFDAKDRFLFVHYSPRPDEDPGVACEALLASITEGLKRARRLEGTLIVLTGGFDRAGGELVVPLIFKVPKRQPIGASRVGPCSLLDVAPTLLDLVGQFDTVRSPGRSLLRGQGGNNPLFGGFYFNDMALMERVVDRGSADRPRALIQTLRGPQFEIGIGPRPGDVTLYDRKKDREGTRNLATDGNADSDRIKGFMLQKLQERRKTIPLPTPPGTRNTPPTAETRAFLDALGFP